MALGLDADPAEPAQRVLVIRWYDLGETIVPAYPGQPAPGCATFLGVTVVHEETSEDVLRVMGDLLVLWRDGLEDQVEA